MTPGEHLHDDTPTEVAAGPAHPLPPLGWYPDPQTPGRERWWSGAEWTRYTARDANKGLFGAAYERAYRSGANTAARRARVLGVTGGLVLIVTTVALGLIGQGLEGGQPIDFLTSYVSGLFGLAAVGAVLLLAGIVLAVVGIRDSRTKGGFVVALHSLLGFSVLIVLLGFFYFVSLLLP